MKSGFCLNENGELLYMVNTKFYDIKDDKTCFESSCKLHNIKGKTLNSYEIKRANIEKSYGFDVLIDFKEDGFEEFRVYKTIEV